MVRVRLLHMKTKADKPPILLTLVLAQLEGVEGLTEGGSGTSLQLTLSNGGHAVTVRRSKQYWLLWD